MFGSDVLGSSGAVVISMPALEPKRSRLKMPIVQKGSLPSGPMKGLVGDIEY
jgi:hypothetical protein